ncbi:Thiamine-phosphate synthase [Aquisphaera giovannonii]|uniref:Thiamine-phosphate synthase n=1 Tax=Aquisphaera giovannonii TaxID=406548 RepID=A0A5B9W9I0_9BACT|nr:thiamine phosphate synthase [Aquisphaera giovannonii]QEH37213.1 Thiamine-phosphate synthase [Aquisphaera giovannonii]
MYEAMTPGAQRVLTHAQARARQRNGTAVEPVDLLAGLVDEEESLAAELLTRFGLDPTAILKSLGLQAGGGSDEPAVGAALPGPPDSASLPAPLPLSSDSKSALDHAASRARLRDRGADVGTEHLLAGLLSAPSTQLADRLGPELQLAPLRDHLEHAFDPPAEPIAPLEGMPPLDLSDPVRSVEIARILDASANRAREGLRVAEDYVRFVLDDPGLTRRLKEVRHRLAEALRGFDVDLLIGSRDTRGDVGTHIMTHSEGVRENPRAVLTANFKRAAEALRTLEEYGKLVDVWVAGRFEVLRYDVYTLEKLTLSAIQAYRGLGDARLMVLVGGLRTLGDLTWIVGEALAGGADVIQLREKGLPDRELLSRAREVRILTAQAKARFILNDRPDLARLASADGVHLGQDDVSVRDARRIVGPNMLIGVSTHDRPQLDAAILSGAGYLGVGPVFPSATKDFAEPELAGLAHVRAAAEATSLPWFAIGGITPENVDRVIEGGATRIAVSASVVRADRPRLAAARLRARLEGREYGEDPETADVDDGDR